MELKTDVQARALAMVAGSVAIALSLTYGSYQFAAGVAMGATLWWLSSVTLESAVRRALLRVSGVATDDGYDRRVGGMFLLRWPLLFGAPIMAGIYAGVSMVGFVVGFKACMVAWMLALLASASTQRQRQKRVEEHTVAATQVVA